jgi:hypothetical protein
MPDQLQKKWKGPFRVILSTPMAAKLEEHPAWVHFRNLKLAAPETIYQSFLTGPAKVKISRLPDIPEEEATLTDKN